MKLIIKLDKNEIKSISLFLGYGYCHRLFGVNNVTQLHYRHRSGGSRATEYLLAPGQVAQVTTD